MRKPDRPLKPHERDLWRGVAKQVNPMHGPLPEPMDHFVPAQKKSAPGAPTKQHKPFAPSARPQTGPGAQPLDGHTQKKLRRGRAAIDAKIDLHGMRQAEAHAALTRFIYRAQDRGNRCVLIITGKGSRGEAHNNPYETPGPGVLRTRLRQWLAQEPLRGMVFGVEEAHPRHGGAGAFYVFIRKKA